MSASPSSASDDLIETVPEDEDSEQQQQHQQNISLLDHDGSPTTRSAWRSPPVTVRTELITGSAPPPKSPRLAISYVESVENNNNHNNNSNNNNTNEEDEANSNNTRSSLNGSTGLLRYDNLLKILVVGDSAVGKTSLINAFVGDLAFAETHMPTIAINFELKVVQVGEKKVKLQIWYARATRPNIMANFGRMTHHQSTR